MRKLIDGKLYDTTTAEMIHGWDNGFPGSDFKSCSETLYRTKKGAWFLHGEGGPMSQYARSIDNNAMGFGEQIQPMDKDEVITWLESVQGIDELMELFPDYIQPA